MVFAWLIAASLALAQEESKQAKVKVLPVPTFGHSPETSTYVGGVSLFTFNLYPDSTTRTSNGKIEFNYTWKKQIILEAAWDYFSEKERWFSKGRIHYSKFPDLYYGIGGQTSANDELLYNSNRLIIEANALKRVGKWFTGPAFSFYRFWNISTDEPNTYTELVSSTKIGLGYSLLKDTRNKLLTPTSGHYIHAFVGYATAQTNYVEGLLDIRYYKPLGKRNIMALRWVNDFNFSTPPFYDYAFLGGNQFVRGYYFGRFRDQYLMSFQSEFRTTLFWRIGLAAFGGVSSIYNDFAIAERSNIKPNIGIGLRFLVDKTEGTNLRIDYAIGEDGNSGFYVAFGEAF